MSLKVISFKKKNKQKVYNLSMSGKNHNYLLEQKIVSANSHSVAYSIISYRTAWLKAHYPHEFYTALLNNSLNKSQDAMVKYIHSARENKIDILPPDINKSGTQFTLDNDTIIFGLAGIKGIGEEGCESVMMLKPNDGFISLEQLLELKVNKKTLTALAESGALEGIVNFNRKQIVDIIPILIDYYKKLNNWNEQVDKYEQNKKDRLKAIEEGKKPPRRRPQPKEEKRPKLPEIEPGLKPTRKERLLLERNTLGFYITGHPLDDYENLTIMAPYTISNIKDGDVDNEDIISIPVVISLIKERNTKKNQSMATMIVEDKTGRIEAIIFPKQWKILKDKLEENSIVILRTRIQKQEWENNDGTTSIVVKLTVNDVSVIDNDISINIEPLNLILNDNTNVKFIPSEETSIYSWQRANAYINNIRRMK